MIRLHPVLRRPLLIAMTAAIVLDQATKAVVILAAPAIGEPHELPVFVGTLIKGWVTIEAGANAGLALSNGTGLGQVAGLFAVVVGGVLVADLALAGDVLPGRVNVALGLVLGGALGNLIDRFRIGSVIDFIRVHVPVLTGYIFNAADVALLAGLAGLAIIGPTPWLYWARAIKASRYVRGRSGGEAPRA